MSQAVNRGRRVAFFGGSFDPPHLGHLAVAGAARAALGLDTVLFAPVGAQPLKPVGATAGFDDRVAMTRLAIEGEPGFTVSLVDAPKASGAPNFTFETLESVQRELGSGCALYCLMGADSFAGLRLWHRAAEIPFVAPLIVASRPGEPVDDLQLFLPSGLTIEPVAASDLPESDVSVRGYSVLAESGRWAGQRAAFYLLPGLDVAISASQIRELAREQVGAGTGGLAAGHELLPDAVAEYVMAHGLYR
jgi:nicotinate-nucleotide adenylyltransferase